MREVKVEYFNILKSVDKVWDMWRSHIWFELLCSLLVLIKCETRQNPLVYKPVYFIVLCLVIQEKNYRSVIVAICCI